MKCIAERKRWRLDGTLVKPTPIVHLVHGTRPHEPGDFMPIACSDEDGITLPGHTFDGTPTCPDCIIIAERRTKRRAARITQEER